MGEGWTKDWERRIVNGVYPLRRFLGQSDHSVVFLTECQAQDLAQAAIKILPPPERALADARLEQWRKIAALSHPHLIRLLDSGRCQLGGHDFLFVVTEYAEQNLAEVLPHRALSPEEVRSLLPATLDALSYLHGEHLVQGGLKPSNFLVVDDQLKLASDTIRSAGERSASPSPRSPYQAPEVKNGRVSAADDVWGLGITLVEALTQTPPVWSREQSEPIRLPANLPAEFVEMAQRCLNRDAARRPTVGELAAKIAPPPAAAPVAMKEPAEPATQPGAQPGAQRAADSAATPAAPPDPPDPPDPPAAPASPPATPEPQRALPLASPPATPEPQRALPPAAPRAAPRDAAHAASNQPSTTPPIRNLPAIRIVGAAVTVGIVTLFAVWIGRHLVHPHDAVDQTMTPPVPVAVPPPPAAVENRKANVTPALSTVLHQESPSVSRAARESIRGVIKIAVRVTVDRSGNVAAASLDNRASSRYFDRAALDAARKWKFSQAPDRALREWLLHFEFSRAGSTARAVAVR